jgi:hypothetical protein
LALTERLSRDPYLEIVRREEEYTINLSLLPYQGGATDEPRAIILFAAVSHVTKGAPTASFTTSSM